MENGKHVLSSREIAEKRGWTCCSGCGNSDGVYPSPRKSNHPNLCPSCHEQWTRTWTREKFCLSRTRRAWDVEAPHSVDYSQMRSGNGFQVKNLDEEERRSTKKLLRKLNRKNLDMILSEVRYLKQKLRAEKRAAKARDENWQQVFGQ